MIRCWKAVRPQSMTVPTAFLRNSDAHKAGPCAGIYLSCHEAWHRRRSAKPGPALSVLHSAAERMPPVLVRMGAVPTLYRSWQMLSHSEEGGKGSWESWKRPKRERHTAEVTSLGQLTCDIG